MRYALQGPRLRWVLAGVAAIVAIPFIVLYLFLRALAPPDVIITEKYISSNSPLTNGIGIEEVRVDSIGEKGYPVKYSVVYLATCNILDGTTDENIAPKKIFFEKKGNYRWEAISGDVPVIHSGLRRHKDKSMEERLWRDTSQKYYETCPLQFKKNTWYFFTIGDPRTTGIFFMIDEKGTTHQHYLESGVSPI